MILTRKKRGWCGLGNYKGSRDILTRTESDYSYWGQMLVLVLNQMRNNCPFCIWDKSEWIKQMIDLTPVSFRATRVDWIASNDIVNSGFGGVVSIGTDLSLKPCAVSAKGQAPSTQQTAVPRDLTGVEDLCIHMQQYWDSANLFGFVIHGWRKKHTRL